MSYRKNIAADTNILFSGLYYKGPPYSLLKHVKHGTSSLYLSEYIRDELVELARDKSVNLGSVATLLSLPEVHVIADSNYTMSELFKTARAIVRDRKDWPIFAFAKFALDSCLVDYFVTGDADLLTPKVRKALNGKIVSASELFESDYL